MAVIVALPVMCEPMAVNADPLSPVAAQEALFDFACDKLASTFAARSEVAHRTQIPGWVRICSAHPRRSKCVDTADLIRGQNRASSLNCGPAVARDPGISDSFLPAFDQSCANVTATWLGNKEDPLQAEAAGWVATCSSHPDVSVCYDAADLIDENRKARPLTCGAK